MLDVAAKGPVPAPLQRSDDIGFREILTYVKQRTSVFGGKCVGEAIAEIESGGVDAFTPGGMSRGDAAGSPFSHLHDRRGHTASKIVQGLVDTALTGDEEGFSQRPAGYPNVALSLHGGDAGVSCWLVQDDGQQRRRVHRDHVGKPRSS